MLKVNLFDEESESDSDLHNRLSSYLYRFVKVCHLLDRCPTTEGE
jgi:hypothetical protein